MDGALADELDEARRQLAAIPGFSTASAEIAQLERLPGLTNRVYKVELPDGRFALRIPGDGTSTIIDRRAEEVNARAAAAAGVAPEVIHFGENGVMLTRFVEGEPLTRERITAPGALERVGATLRRLHDDVPAFASRLGPFATIDAYAGVLAERGTALSARQREILDAAQGVRAVLAASPVAFKACHCDPTGRNLLDTGKKVWLIDWEYSGMNDPYWDLAYCSFQAGLPEPADARLLAAHLGHTPQNAEAARMEVMKAPIALMSALWAMIQERSGNKVADFSAYASDTFELAGERMRSAAFKDAVGLLRGA
jgi:thiamine kinase-like enzyme